MNMVQLFVEELESRRETTVCLHWKSWVAGREWEVEGKKGGEGKWAGFPRAPVGIGGRLAEQLLGKVRKGERN